MTTTDAALAAYLGTFAGETPEESTMNDIQRYAGKRVKVTPELLRRINDTSLPISPDHSFVVTQVYVNTMFIVDAFGVQALVRPEDVIIQE